MSNWPHDDTYDELFVSAWTPPWPELSPEAEAEFREATQGLFDAFEARPSFTEAISIRWSQKIEADEFASRVMGMPAQQRFMEQPPGKPTNAYRGGTNQRVALDDQPDNPNTE